LDTLWMSKTAQMSIKMDPQLAEDFTEAVKLEAKIHNFEDHGAQAILRQLMREYIARVQSTAQSEVGRAAAKTLAKRVRS